MNLEICKKCNGSITLLRASELMPMKTSKTLVCHNNGYFASAYNNVMEKSDNNEKLIDELISSMEKTNKFSFLLCLLSEKINITETQINILKKIVPNQNCKNYTEQYLDALLENTI